MQAQGAVPLVQGEGGDDAMAIDEEGRPRFAPAKDLVRLSLGAAGWPSVFVCETDLKDRILCQGLKLERSRSLLTG